MAVRHRFQRQHRSLQQLRILRVMGHHQHRAPLPALLHKPRRTTMCLLVQSFERLVQQHGARSVRQHGPGQCHTPPLPASQKNPLDKVEKRAQKAQARGVPPARQKQR